jgi:uncharacterized pyridoxamine 5'-phosphate oxidase family protein
MRTICNLIFLLSFCHISVAQTKDIPKLTENEKKQELISSLEWLESKMGNGMEFSHRDGYYYYYELFYNISDPSKISISKVRSDTQKVLKTISFELSKIYKITINNKKCFFNIRTYEGQRFITVEENNETLLENHALFSYDCAVSKERMNKALEYILKLGNGGKPVIYEKF